MSANTIMVGNGTISLPSLEASVDAAFKTFYQSFGSGLSPDPVAFDAAVTPFLSQSTVASEHDAYFNSFTPLWTHWLQEGKASEAIAVWPWALRPVLGIENRLNRQLHKGTPYYFWGMTVLLQGNLEEGYLLMHRALEEDFRTHGNAAPDTPGWALATLNHQKQEQAFLPWVKKQAANVESRLEAYRTANRRTLTLEVLRARLLTKLVYRDTVQLFCYSMARTQRLLSLPQELWDGSFPAQIAFDVLFDLCLVVDAALHFKNPGQGQFIDHSTFLSKACALGLPRDELRRINGLFRVSFPYTLRNALAGELRLSDETPVSGLSASLAVAYGCRNRGAHDVSSVSISSSEFAATMQHICNVFFLTVEDLYE